MKITTLQEISDSYWEEYQFIYPELNQYHPPKIILSDKLTRVAGWAQTEDSLICLGSRFLEQFEKQMIGEILPHELAHCIDHLLFGWQKYKRAHGKLWQQIMIEIGQSPCAYHSMRLK